MRGHHIALAIILFLAAVVALNTLYIVHQSEQALVLQFGRPVAVIREPGLKWKIPFIQNVVFFEKRLLEFNADPKEVIASDKKRLIIDAFVRYRITDPLAFYQTVGTEMVMRDRLNTNLESALRNVVGNVPLNTIISSARAQVMQDIKEALNNQMASMVTESTSTDEAGKKTTSNTRGFGVEIVDVRIMRADLPQENSEAIFNRMKTEREREAKNFRGGGAEDAQKIRSKAERDRTVLIAEAQKQAETIRGEGDAKAAKIFADAFGQDKEFFEFYRSMQAYRKALNNKDTTLILSPNSEFLREMNEPK